MFSSGREQTVGSMTLPFEYDGNVHVMVMNVFGSSSKQAVTGIDEKATEIVDAMVKKLNMHGFTLLDVDVYPDPSTKGLTGASCYKAIFKVK